LNKDGTVKLGDLNVSKVAKMGLVYTQTGTPYYASPEVWQDKPYDNRSDIWSLGCVIYEMITLRPPFTASSMQELATKVKKGSYPKISSRYSKDLQTVIAHLLKVSPLMRPSCEQILHLPAVEEHLTDEETHEICKELLNTIKIPRNMNLLNGKLPAAQYEDVKVDEEDEEKYEDDDFEHPVPTIAQPTIKSKKISPQKHRTADPEPIKRDNTERVIRRPKGLPPTAPAPRPSMPITNRPEVAPDLNGNSNEGVLKSIKSRKGQRAHRGVLEGGKKKRKNPKTTESQLVEVKPNRYQMYRMHSREKQRENSNSKERQVSQNRLKDNTSLPELKIGQRNLRQKYSDRIYNANNKYLSKDYSSISGSGKRNLIQQRRAIIDPTNNAQKLEQILGNKVNASRDSKQNRYHPLSENYRGIENKLSIQAANPGHNYNLIGRAGSRGHNISSITPHSGRKDNILISRLKDNSKYLKENYKNANISKHGYYVPPVGLRKAGNLNSQRSQPILGGLRNNLSKRYMSNQQYSLDHGNIRGLPPTGIVNQKRSELSSVQQHSRVGGKPRSSNKPMSAKSPSWWG
jgi:hypothetical protein